MLVHGCAANQCRCPEYDSDRECGLCEAYTDGRTCTNCDAARCEGCRTWVPIHAMAEADDAFCQACYDAEPMAEVG